MTDKPQPSEDELETLANQLEEIITAVHFDEISPEVAYDQTLALIRTEQKKLLAEVMERKREYTRDGAPGGIAEAVPVAIIEQKIKSLEGEKQ